MALSLFSLPGQDITPPCLMTLFVSLREKGKEQNIGSLGLLLILKRDSKKI